MEPYEIKYDFNQTSAKCLRWFIVLQGIFLIGMFGLGYHDEGLNGVHYIQFIIGLGFIVIGIFWYKTFLFQNSSITFKEQLITYSIRNKEMDASWEEVSAFKLTGDHLTLQFVDNHEQRIDIRWMNYDKRQEAKQRLRDIADFKNISFNYKF